MHSDLISCCILIPEIAAQPLQRHSAPSFLLPVLKSVDLQHRMQSEATDVQPVNVYFRICPRVRRFGMELLCCGHSIILAQEHD
jgi:hypothetical protein